MRRPLRKPHGLRNEDIENYDETVHYTVYPEGANYIVLNGSTGKEDLHSTNATTAIQYAIDNLTAGRDYPESIVLKGAFAIPSTIEITSFTHLFINGSLKLNANVDDHVIETTGNVENFLIQGGLIDGNRANQGAGNWDGINVAARESKCRIINVEINECKRDGIYADSPLGGFIQGCYIHHVNKNCIHIHKEHWGIYHNTCLNSGDKGIYLSDVLSTHNRVIGNSCSANKYGIKNEGTENIFIGNTCSFNTEFSGMEIGSLNNVLIGNRCNDNPWYGIQIGGSYATVIGNFVFNNGAGTRDGIYVGGDHNVVSNNIVGDSAGSHQVYGIEIAGDNNKISDNSIYGNITADIFDSGNYNLINGIGVESADAEEPQQTWYIGATVQFTDSGDASGDGIYIKDVAGNWTKIN